MKTRTKNSTFHRATTICVLMGYYNDTNQYCETYTEDINLDRLPEYVIREVSWGDDVSIMIVPREGIFVFAERDDMDRYKVTFEAGHVKGLLDAFSNLIIPDGSNLWARYNFPA